MSISTIDSAHAARAFFITIDGSDAVGKSTQIKLISAWLQERDIAHHCTREPGGTQLGEKLRAILLDKTQDIDAISELLLILAARRQHLQRVILPHLQRGEWVICDRFNDATYAYQGYARGVALDLISALEKLLAIDLEPDLRFIIEINDACAHHRLTTRQELRDRFESESSQFFSQVAAGYRQRAKNPQAKLIDGSASPTEVFTKIAAYLRELI